MANLNYKKYKSKHWSELPNPENALEKYLNQYSDVYNSNNIERFLEIIRAYNQKLSILDYGGGCGLLACKAAELNHNVVLADQSQSALNASQILASRMNVDVKTICTQYAASLPDNEFDIILLKDLIEHVVDDEQLICDISKSLKPNGILLITTQNSLSPNFFIEGLARKIKNPSKKWLGWDRTHIRFYKPNRLKQLLAISDISFSHFNSAYIFPYKLLLLLPLSKSQLDKLYFFGFSIDKVLCKYFPIKSLGWNLMIVGRKKSKVIRN